MQAAFSEHHVENPEFMGIHYMDATSVEECWRLLRQTGKSISYESLANVPRYSAWLAEQDWTDAYERHRANLQLIGLNDPEKRWVLKNPSHLVALDALMTVYPDALVVCTHRDPVISIASACSLSAEATAGTSTTFVGETVGRTQLEMLSRSWRTFTKSRAALRPGAVRRRRRTTTSWPDPVRTTRSRLRRLRPRLDAGGRRRGHRARRRVTQRWQATEAHLLARRLRPDRGRGPGGLLTGRPDSPANLAASAEHGQKFGTIRCRCDQASPAAARAARSASACGSVRSS